MAENSPTNPAPNPAPSVVDSAPQRFKERVTAIIAIIVVAGTVLLAFSASLYLSDKEAFERAKDLLLFVNPIVGYVIGYYFNKTVTDKTVDLADQKAQAAEAKNGTLKTTLRTVVDAGRAAMTPTRPQAKVLEGTTEPYATSARAPEQARLVSALDRAEAVLSIQAGG